MQIEIKEIEPCKLVVHYEANAEEILNKRAEVINAFKKAPVPGFRKGKASVDAIKIHYRDQIEESLKRALAEDAYHNTLFEKKVKPHGAPRFNILQLADGKFSCEFDLLTKPDFTLAPFTNLEIPKPHEPMTVAELSAKMLEDLRYKLGKVSPYTDEDFVQTGDSIIIDYEGSIDGEKLDSLSAEGEMLTVGKSDFLDFDSNLLGMTMGQTREFDLVVPENGLPSFAGKRVHFKATVNMGSKTEPSALDDDLAVKLGKADFKELQESINQLASGRVASHARSLVNAAVSAKLVADNTLEVPNWMSLSEAQYLAHSAKVDWNVLSDEDKEKYIELGEKNVKLALILDKIRETEPEAQLSDQEVFEIVKRNLSQTKTDKPIDEVIKEMNRTGYMQIIFSRVRDEYALDFVVKSAKLVE